MGAAIKKLWGEVKGGAKTTEKQVKAGADEAKELAA